jgi:hypothetical protein
MMVAEGTETFRCILVYDKTYLCININQLGALNFIISLFQASTCFEHMCSKHVEAWNNRLILINKYIEMHGQQNIKIYDKTYFVSEHFVHLVVCLLHKCEYLLMYGYGTCKVQHGLLWRTYTNKSPSHKGWYFFPGTSSLTPVLGMHLTIQKIKFVTPFLDQLFFTVRDVQTNTLHCPL